MKNLLLTLGHNSSAILVEENKVIWGYETERISGVKSDSRFPASIIAQAVKMERPDMVYVSHWAPNGNLSSMKDKYWKPEVFDGIPIRTLTPDRSHHDAHIYGAMCYAGQSYVNTPNTYGFVIDGFGTMGEHLSVYKFEHGRPHLVRRIRGYDTSLGLWYQYATAYMGMKMHEDEYKLLGYEVHCKQDDADRLDKLAQAYGYEWLQRMDQTIYGSKFDPVYDLGALDNVRGAIFQHLNEISTMFGVADPSSFDGRALLAYYVQAVLESVVLEIVKSYGPDNVLLSGGVFYNVKLNKRIIDTVKGCTCIYPLAGDQGNAIGLYYMDHPDFQFPSTLNWGVRDLSSKGTVAGLYVTSSQVLANEIIHGCLKHVGYVNLVRGAMEFGPRAMCNTSTLALPRKDIVEKINTANDRNTVMPMAPVMTRRMYERLFKHTDRLYKSDQHMITAMEFNEIPGSNLSGICHEYKRPYRHATGRPQVTRDSDNFLNGILNELGHPLINTSFNFHGHPIAFDMESVIKNHMLQRQRDENFMTVVLK